MTTKPNGKQEAPQPSGKIIASGTLRQRLQAIREEVTYIRRTPLGEKAPYKSAVAHEVLIQKVRPFMVRAGIMWRPIQVEVLDNWHGKSKEDSLKLYHWAQVRSTIRFERTDDPTDFLDVQVLTDGWDDFDKAGPKAMTYADKAALLSILNLERGDDPDFDMAMSNVDDATAQRITKLRDLAAANPDFCGPDPDVYLRGELVRLARSKGRTRVPNLWHLTDDELDHWYNDLKEQLHARDGHRSQPAGQGRLPATRDPGAAERAPRDNVAHKPPRNP